MKPSAAVYDLVHSLRKSEKRYFKLLAGRHKDDSQLLRLFDAIAKQKVYDEEALRELFKDSRYYQQFHVLKNRLYQLILKSMGQYHQEKSPEGIMQAMLSNIEFLRGKGLQGQVLKLLKKARAYAEKHELHLALLTVLRHERQISYQVLNKEFQRAESSDHFLAQEKEILDRYENYCQYSALAYRMYLLWTRSHLDRNALDVEGFREILSDPLFAGPEQALSFDARYLYYATAATLYMTVGESEKSLNCRRDLVAMIGAQSPERIRKLAANYVIALLNFLMQAIRQEQFAEVRPGLEKIRAIPADSLTTEARIFSASYYIELMYLNRIGQFEAGTQLIPAVVAGLEKYGDSFDLYTNVWFRFQFFSCNLGAGKLKAALHWLNDVLNHPSVHKISEIESTARFCNILLHYELGNFDLMEGLYRSTYRYFQKREGEGAFASMLLPFFKDLLSKPFSNAALLERFGLLRDEIQALKSATRGDIEIVALEAFDFVSWIDSKINGEAFDAVVRSKYPTAN